MGWSWRCSALGKDPLAANTYNEDEDLRGGEGSERDQ